jgi:hypothetical protein
MGGEGTTQTWPSYRPSQAIGPLGQNGGIPAASVHLHRPGATATLRPPFGIGAGTATLTDPADGVPIVLGPPATPRSAPGLPGHQVVPGFGGSPKGTPGHRRNQGMAEIVREPGHLAGPGHPPNLNFPGRPGVGGQPGIPGGPTVAVLPGQPGRLHAISGKVGHPVKGHNGTPSQPLTGPPTTPGAGLQTGGLAAPRTPQFRSVGGRGGGGGRRGLPWSPLEAKPSLCSGFAPRGLRPPRAAHISHVEDHLHTQPHS